MLAQEAKIHKLQTLEEALESSRHARAGGGLPGTGGTGELGPKDSSEDSVITGVVNPVLQDDG